MCSASVTSFRINDGEPPNDRILSPSPFLFVPVNLTLLPTIQSCVHRGFCEEYHSEVLHLQGTSEVAALSGFDECTADVEVEGELDPLHRDSGQYLNYRTYIRVDYDRFREVWPTDSFSHPEYAAFFLARLTVHSILALFNCTWADTRVSAHEAALWTNNKRISAR